MIRQIPITVLGFFFFVAACSNGGADNEYWDVGELDSPAMDFSHQREAFDEDAAREAAEIELADEGYDYSYGCTDDCSGHEAGWQWRAENDYTPNSWSDSFNEGAMAFEDAVEDRIEEMQDDYEFGYDPDY